MRMVNVSEQVTPMGTFQLSLVRDAWGLGLVAVRSVGIPDAGLLMFSSTSPVDTHSTHSRWLFTATNNLVDIAGEVSGSTFAAVYPLAWFKIMWRMPKDYWQVALYTVPIFILVVVWETASRMLTPHWLVDIVLALPANFLWFSIACLCGRVIYLHEEDFGFRSSDRPTYGERKPL